MINQPLNKSQIEILKLFRRELPESDMVEIKRLIAKYLAGKIMDAADEVWDQNAWTDDEIDKLLKTHERTPYYPENKLR